MQHEALDGEPIPKKVVKMKLSKITKSTFKFSGATFTIKKLLSGDILSINDSSNDITIELKKVEGEFLPARTVSSSPMTEKFMTVQKSVVAWENVFDEDGKELVCDNAGKKQFCECLDIDIFNDFFKKLTEESNKLTEVAKKQSEKAVKN